MGQTQSINTTLLSLLSLIALGACGGQVEILSQSLPCVDNSDCPAGESCLVNRCAPYGSVIQDETCTDEDQCAEGLTCFGFQCVPGCSDVYQVDDCDENQFCKPVDHSFVRDEEGVRSMVGTCEASECDPGATTETCPTGQDLRSCHGHHRSLRARMLLRFCRRHVSRRLCAS